MRVMPRAPSSVALGIEFFRTLPHAFAFRDVGLCIFTVPASLDRPEGSKMLVLSRKLGEKIYIGDNICITVVDIDRGKIRLGIEAPRDVPIYRQELLPLHQRPDPIPPADPD